MASMNTNNNEELCPCPRCAVPIASYHDDDFEEDDVLEFNGETLKVQITNDTFGTTSVKQTVKALMRRGYSKKYIEQMELAQLLSQGDDESCESEFYLIQGIINSSKDSERDRHDQENRCKMEAIHNDSRRLAVKTLLKRKQTDIAEQAEKQATKNAKRNAKRRAKAKKTKETLNFTPTKEQEEWFWGGAPHGGDEGNGDTEYGSDGFPTDEEYDRKEIELGGPAIHCGGGRWKLG